MEIFLSSIYAAFFCYLLFKLRFFKIDEVSPFILVGIFFIKLLSALALTVIYTYYYTDRSTADIFKYFDDAKVIFSALHLHPYDYFRMLTGFDSDAPELKHYYLRCNFWYKEYSHILYNDNRTIIRYNAFLLLLSFGKFFVHNVFTSFLSLIGLMGIYKVFVYYYPNKKYALLIAIFLLPSVLLWTSGTLKEGIVVFAFGMFFYTLWSMLFNRFMVKYLIICISAVFILSLAKYYVILCAVPGVLYLIGRRFFSNKSQLFTLAISVTICIAVFLTGRMMGGKYDVITSLTYKQNDFVTFSLSLDKVGSLMDTTLLQPSVIDFAKNCPQGLYKSLFKPLPWDVHNILSILPAFENSVLILLMIMCVIWYKRRQASMELLLFSVSFVVCLNTLNGLIVPVFGAIVRYKVPGLPFLFASLVCLIDFDAIKKRLSK